MMDFLSGLMPNSSNPGVTKDPTMMGPPGPEDAQKMMQVRQLAGALRGTGAGAPARGRMVGNQYVPPSWTEHAASFAGTALGGRMPAATPPAVPGAAPAAGNQLSSLLAGWIK